MSLFVEDIEELGRPRSAFVALDGPAEGVEIEVCYATPVEAQRWRNRLRSRGILNKNDDIASGQEKAYCEEFVRQYVRGWRGVNVKATGEPAPYDAGRMALILTTVSSAFRMLNEAVGQEVRFFTRNGSGST